MTTALQSLAPAALAAVHGGGVVEDIDSDIAHYPVGDPERCARLPYVLKQLKSPEWAGRHGAGWAQLQTELDLQQCNQR